VRIYFNGQLFQPPGNAYIQRVPACQIGQAPKAVGCMDENSEAKEQVGPLFSGGFRRTK